ncbi:MAG TPA: TraR/DksA family transcriptional regulator [Planctomycetota bacterium]|jgi:DnaK suppressor protein
MPKSKKKASASQRRAAVKRPSKRISARKSKPVSSKSTVVVKKAKSVRNNGAEHKPTPAAPLKPLTAELQQLRSRLSTMLTDVHENINQEVRGASDRDLAHINDTSDMASDAAEGDLALRIAESETVEAGEIQRAIEKIDNGTYGSCEMCNKAIGADRLHYLPYVTLCIKCQALAEIRKREKSDELDDLTAEGSDGESENG